jgi:hypothetical protein
MVFFAIWWAWMNFTWFASAYDTDDNVYRLATLVQITGALTLAAGVPRAFDETDHRLVTYGYVIMRLALVAQWLRAARSDPERRRTALARSAQASPYRSTTPSTSPMCRGDRRIHGGHAGGGVSSGRLGVARVPAPARPGRGGVPGRGRPGLGHAIHAGTGASQRCGAGRARAHHDGGQTLIVLRWFFVRSTSGSRMNWSRGHRSCGSSLSSR